MAGGVSGGRDQGEAGSDDVGDVDDIGQSGIEDGLDRLQVHIDLSLVKVLRRRVSSLLGAAPSMSVTGFSACADQWVSSWAAKR
ncbi:hypothetical protein MMUR_06360 [Mycolicibacterium murale]|uniref:Uncharacterized protein n=1 Tax=Mycolicibacterium murale TaxID=182220 RepID=A0A7I9WGR7_9MYCO|nr:hypothetical protein MMUR_06360 [Mycolicibacterium murale]